MNINLNALLEETRDWANLHHPSGAVCVHGTDRRYWRLSDYVVSTASGPVLWLVRRQVVPT
jgi:hypothetical protein